MFRFHRWAWLCGALLLTLAASGAWAASKMFVFYEVQEVGKPDVDIYLRQVDSTGKLGWGNQENALPFATADDTETSPVACADGQGGGIVVYCYKFNSGKNKGDMDVVAQRVNAAGKTMWNEGKGPVAVGSSDSAESNPVIISDGQGGAFVAWEWTSAKKDTDLLVQHIGADGKLLWNNGDPVAVGASDSPEHGPVIVPDGAGGIIVLFDWTGENDDTDVMAQRVGADGKVLWNEGKQATDVCATDHSERHIAACPDGNGGAIAVFEVEYLTGDHKGDIDLVAQRIGGDGVLTWGKPDEPADVATSDGLDCNPYVLADGKGGAWVAFEYEPRKGDNAGDRDIAAQHIGPDGKSTLEEGKAIYVGSSKHLETGVGGVALQDGGAVLVFELKFVEGENKGDVDLAAQRLDAAGKLLWEKGEKSVLIASSKWLERGARVLEDEDGAIVVAYTGTGVEEKWKGDQDVEILRVSGEGKLMWNDGKESVHVADDKTLERNPAVVVVSAGQ